MAYSKVFTPTYPDGWEDIPSHDTPVTAGVMDDYDEAIEHIEDFLNGSSAVFPMQVTGGMTQPIGIDENGRLFTYPSGGGAADEITYDNTESGLQSDDVQGAIDELADGAGGSTAATTTYDNTESGLEAENCQDAIDELVTLIGRGSGGIWTKLLDVRDESSQTANSYNLSDSILNYDTIIVKGYYVYNSKYVVYSGAFNVDNDLIDNYQTLMFQSGASNALAFSFNSTGDVINKQESSANNYIFAVYGYNGGSSETVIFNTDTTLAQGTVIALDESVKNYKEIVIRAHYETGGISLYNDCYFRTSSFDYGVSTTYYSCNIYHGGNAAFYFTIDSNGENLTIGGTLGGAKISEIIGIK